MICQARRQIWRVTAVVLLAALTAGTLGIAVPRLVDKISDQLYPCMNCSCSCASAEACWRNCCCFTQQEKLAWAEKVGVEPPEFVVAAARAEAELPPCCRMRLAGSCCGKQRSCCPSRIKPQDRAVAQTAPRRPRTVILLDELRCQGLGVHWTMLPPYVLPPLICVDDDPARRGEAIAFTDQFSSGQLPPPELPPPERDV